MEREGRQIEDVAYPTSWQTTPATATTSLRQTNVVLRQPRRAQCRINRLAGELVRRVLGDRISRRASTPAKRRTYRQLQRRNSTGVTPSARRNARPRLSALEKPDAEDTSFNDRSVAINNRLARSSRQRTISS
jgi:hypothetical protein